MSLTLADAKPYSASDMAPRGGWEPCLLDAVPDDCQCLICYDVMVQPKSACSNGHAACSECFDAHFAHFDSMAGAKCPGGCGESIRRGGLKVKRSVAEKLDSVPARCKHASQSTDGRGSGDEAIGVCSWMGTFGELLTHLRSECPLEYVECPYRQLGCTKPIRRKDMASHLASAALQHMSMAGSTIATLTQSVAALTSTVATLQDQVGLARMQLAGALPRFVELRLTRAHGGENDDGDEESPSTTSVLPDITKAYLGLYRLDETTRINGMPLYIHCQVEVASGLDWTGLGWAGLGWAGLDWTGWTGLDLAGLHSS